MYKNKTLLTWLLSLLIGFFLWSGSVAQQSGYNAESPTYELAETGGVALIQPGESQALGVSRALLWDNGPLVNSPGTGPGGSDHSLLQNVSLGMTTLGAANYVPRFSMADDFEVDGEWTIDQFTFMLIKPDPQLLQQ